MRAIAARASILAIFILAASGVVGAEQLPPAPPADSGSAAPIPGGELRVAGGAADVAPCPLKRTEVHAGITGNVAQVRVNQVFQNPYDRPIEAVYLFPLPHKAAVDDMEIRLGDRIIRGVIKKREEARAMYDEARRSGRTAALLDQERPNVFTQSVANILPGEEVTVSLRYFDVLPYDAGVYEFTFPMVVGPRFIPGAPVGQSGGGRSPDTTIVPDASRITPPILKSDQRSGHDISLEVQLQAGALLHDLASPSHAVDLETDTPARALIRLRQEDSIPNKDFVLRYRLDGAAPEVVVLPHRTEGPGYFLMLIQPEAQPPKARVLPKEMIFVVDCSGSMSGFPIEKVKEAIRYALESLNPLDNFQIIRFSYRADAFAPEPVPATPAWTARALEYVDGLSGMGGTIMLDGVKTALAYPEDPQRLRIISFMTDGYIGNEEQILAYLREHLGGARLFSFGVGDSPSRYLLEKMAEFGHGSVQYMLLNTDSAGPVRDFTDKIRNPYLTDLAIDWGDFRVSEVYPPQIPDLFLSQPVVLLGRYEQGGAGAITLRGRLGGQPYERRLMIQLPERWDGGEALASLWARSKIEALSNQAIGNPQPGLAEEITNVALAHNLVSAYTSFVAVEERPRTAPDVPACVQVPLPLPEGTSEEGITGGVVGGVIGGVLGGVPGGVPQRVYKETIRVAGKEEVVNTSSTKVSTTISSEFISGLPVLGRDYQDVLALAPGVTDSNSSAAGNVHGARDTNVVTLVDGADTSDPRSGEFAGDLDLASIQEIEVIVQGATAEFTRAEGGFVGIIKGGKAKSKNSRATRSAEPFPTLCRLGAARKEHHLGKEIVLYLAIRNLSTKPIAVPASLSVSDGTALFRILDEGWNEVPHPQPGTNPASQRQLSPGDWIVFTVTVNGGVGYKLDRPGVYHLVFLGSSIGLVDSTQLTLRIEP